MPRRFEDGRLFSGLIFYFFRTHLGKSARNKPCQPKAPQLGNFEPEIKACKNYSPDHLLLSKNLITKLSKRMKNK